MIKPLAFYSPELGDIEDESPESPYTPSSATDSNDKSKDSTWGKGEENVEDTPNPLLPEAPESLSAAELLPSNPESWHYL